MCREAENDGGTRQVMPKDISNHALEMQLAYLIALRGSAGAFSYINVGGQGV
jgi:hypothetical protein